MSSATLQRKGGSLALLVSLSGIAVAEIGLRGVAVPGLRVALLGRWRVLIEPRVTLALRLAFAALAGQRRGGAAGASALA
ncbi:MAG: hypothetical protein HY699_17945 [Deltaproteobacteria bacterium]|nr:hypothetical protein [Deltaproteobacteria bacterium]